VGTFPTVAAGRAAGNPAAVAGAASGEEPAGFEPDPVVEVTVREVSMPLDTAVVLGAQRITARQYAVLELRSAAGRSGVALGLTRGLPVARALESLAPALLGADAGARRALLDRIVQTRPNAALGLSRALGLVDVAMWDLLAKRACLPLWRLLGGCSARVALVVAAGYATAGGAAGETAGELRRLEDAGFTHLKVHAEDPALIAGWRAALSPGTELAVDLGMGCADLVSARRLCAALDDLGLWFIEDPFPPERAGLTAELARHLRTPLAAGEDALGEEMLVELADAAGVLRVDATASGGVDAVLGATAHAARRGRLVITHSVVELHGQLAGGMSGIGFAETIPYDSGANPLHRLLASTQPVEHGQLVLSERPGNGLVLDGEAVERHTIWGARHAG
jgi:L-alanine-DL-glutamate epimerase-like enolase superfamily enzyme